MYRGLILIALLVFTGCGDPNKGVVSGTILVDGEPAEGSISFVPVDGKTAPQGDMIEEGKYEVELPVGQTKVEIRVARVIGQKRLYETDPNSEVANIYEESLPPKFNDETELTYEVPSGKSTKDFDLEAKKKKKRR